MQRPGDLLKRTEDPTNVKLLEHKPIKLGSNNQYLNESAFKETDEDVLRLQKMIKEEGLEHVEEVRL